jgi:cysteine sulfinate desulfinase/cysteine desulfurase-like protein
LFDLKKQTISLLADRIPTCSYLQYITRRSKLPEIEIVFISGHGNDYLPNTILLSVVKRTKPWVCNVKIKEALAKRGIIISVGSACNTSSPRASHVLYALGADQIIRKGALRISFGDDSGADFPKIFVGAFLDIIKKMYGQ